MKHLKITYGDAVLWDAPVGSLEWHDSENGVRIDGRVNAARPASAGSARGGGILDMLAKASKAKTSQMAEEKREAYEDGGVAKRNTVIETGIAEAAEPEVEDSA